MTAATDSIVVCCVFFFSISEASVRAARARHQTYKLVGEFTCIPTHILVPVSAPQKTPRTVNTCRNIPCFFPLDDRGDRTNHLHWLELLDTWYISLLNQTVKGRVFYSADKCFETEADPRNIFDKQSLKFWTPCLSAFYCVIPRATLALSLKARAIARFWKSVRALSKKYREPPSKRLIFLQVM